MRIFEFRQSTRQFFFAWKWFSWRKIVKCLRVVTSYQTKLHTYAKFELESFVEKVMLHIRDTIHVSRSMLLRSRERLVGPTSEHRDWFIHSARKKNKQTNLSWQIRHHMLTFYMVHCMHVAKWTITYIAQAPYSHLAHRIKIQFVFYIFSCDLFWTNAKAINSHQPESLFWSGTISLRTHPKLFRREGITTWKMHKNDIVPCGSQSICEQNNRF